MEFDPEQELTAVAQKITAPDYGYREASVRVGAQLLELVDSKYGLGSPRPLLQHNVNHSLEVTDGVVELINIIYPFMTHEQRVGVYDKALIAGPGHDAEQDLGEEENERASGLIVEEFLIASGDELLTLEEFRRGVNEGIIATTAVHVLDEKTDEVKILQPHVMAESRDPFSWAMAKGDLGGIPMRGLRRLIGDPARLYFDKAEKPSIDGLCSMLLYQQTFLRSQLQEEQTKEELGFFFDEDSAEVLYQTLYEKYHDRVIEMYGLAKSFESKLPLIRSKIELALKGADFADRALLGKRVISVLESILT
jgi:hypothetical protein